jgi:hypothetical protein
LAQSYFPFKYRVRGFSKGSEKRISNILGSGTIQIITIAIEIMTKLSDKNKIPKDVQGILLASITNNSFLIAKCNTTRTMLTNIKLNTNTKGGKTVSLAREVIGNDAMTDRKRLLYTSMVGVQLVT